MSDLSLCGVIPPMITPFKENGDVDYEKFNSNIERWNDAELSGYLVLGSNSETVYLTEDEKLTLIKETVAHANKDRFVLAGTGMESTKETIRLTTKAARLGVHAALILTPFYYINQMNDAALIHYFTEVANQSEIPILIYNVPKFTHINISSKAVYELSKHPNIIGMKDSSANVPQLVNFKNIIDEDFILLVGTAAIWYPALSIGIKGGIMALANIAPNECAEVQSAFESNNEILAQEIYNRIHPVNTAVTATYGIAGLKYAADLLGFEGGWVRSPLLLLDEKDKSELRQILTAARLL